MTRARRGNAVLAYSCANLKGHFAKNGYKRDLRAVRGKGSFRAGKRLQEPPAPVVWGRKPGEPVVSLVSRGGVYSGLLLDGEVEGDIFKFLNFRVEIFIMDS